jgi:hypothetical protein
VKNGSFASTRGRKTIDPGKAGCTNVNAELVPWEYDVRHMAEVHLKQGRVRTSEPDTANALCNVQYLPAWRHVDQRHGDVRPLGTRGGPDFNLDLTRQEDLAAHGVRAVGADIVPETPFDLGELARSHLPRHGIEEAADRGGWVRGITLKSIDAVRRS